MNILFLCHRVPYPPDKGDKIRAFHLLMYLAKRHKVSVATFADDSADLRHLETLTSLIGGDCLIVPLGRLQRLVRMGLAMLAGKPLTTAFFSSARLRRWVQQKIATQPIDRVVLFSSAMAPIMLGLPFDKRHVMLDMVDIDSDKWRQYASASSGLRSWLFGREARTLFELERRSALTFGSTLLVSQFEADGFAEMVPAATERIHSVPNGVDLSYFSADRLYENPFSGNEIPIVMTGTMDYRPNDDGAYWFATEILPLVQRVLPGAKFYVVGARPSQRLKALSNGTVVTGSVPDVRPYLAHAATVVAPLLMARGVQNKVLEAMAMSQPVVATTPATRALDVESGVHLWVQDDVNQFAHAVVAAAESDERSLIAANGRKYVEERHDWDQTLADIDRLLNQDSPSAALKPTAPAFRPTKATSLQTENPA